MTFSRTDVADTIICAMAAEIGTGDLVGVGLGTPMAVAAALLARATHAPTAMVLAGGAFDARADLATYLSGSRALVGSTVGWVSHFDSMDMAERQAMTLQFLRPAQVDGNGDINISRIGSLERPEVRLPGGLAAADVPHLLPRIVVYLPDHRSRNLPDRVAYRTGPGRGWDGRRFPTRGVIRLITDLAVIEFGGDTAQLVSVHHWAEEEQVRSRTGFRLESLDVLETPAPNPAQLEALKELDPDNRRAAEIRTSPAATPGGTAT